MKAGDLESIAGSADWLDSSSQHPLWSQPMPKGVLQFLAYTACVAEDAHRRISSIGSLKGETEALVAEWKAEKRGASGEPYPVREGAELMERWEQIFHVYVETFSGALQHAAAVRKVFGTGLLIDNLPLGISHVTLYTPAGKRHVLVRGNRLDMMKGLERTRTAAVEYAKARLGLEACEPISHPLYNPYKL